jgi:uncharacterized cupin superfamily protein
MVTDDLWEMVTVGDGDGRFVSDDLSEISTGDGDGRFVSEGWKSEQQEEGKP